LADELVLWDQAKAFGEALAKAGAEVNPGDFYPPVKQHKGKSRDLPLINGN
jgi:hypothetical protein